MHFKVSNPLGVALLLVGLFSPAFSIPLAAREPKHTLQPITDPTLNANPPTSYLRETRGQLSDSASVYTADPAPNHTAEDTATVPGREPIASE